MLDRYGPWTALALAAALAAAGCSPGADLLPTPDPTTEVHTELTYLVDGYGRYLTVHGVNLGGSTKTPFTAPYDAEPEQVYFNDLEFSYVGRPFPLDEADHWFEVINSLGFNAVRFILNWEAIEPEAKGEYNTEYLDYVDEMVAAAERNGIYVLMDMHQDMFSRHVFTRMNERPYETLADAGIDDADVVAASVMTMVPPFTDTMRGDGAPRWAVQAALPHKQMDSPHWGDPHIMGQLDLELVLALVEVIQLLTGAEDGEIEVPGWASYVLQNLPAESYGMDETTNMLPWSMWGINNGTSVDQEMCWAAFLAGADVFPTREIGGQNVQDYLQEAYADAWRQVAMRAAAHENVIGYDLMNEPNGIYLALTLAAVVGQTGMMDGVEQMLMDLLGEELGPTFYTVFAGLNLIPPDNEPETMAAWGLDDADLLAVAGLNIGHDANYLEPFYSRIGQAIQDEDPGAVIWIESSSGLEVVTGGGVGGGVMEVNMVHPAGIDQLVYAPHWYPDIYPMVGLVREPREFDVEEIRYREYGDKIADVASRAAYSLGNVPVVFGEFGTYYNYNGIEASVADDYAVSAHILDNYYEAFEETTLSRMQWVFTTDNSYEEGDWWNGEDFSVLDPAGDARGELAFSRPYARALAGKPVATHFYGPLHYFDPDKETPDPVGEFYVEYESRESSWASEIFVPEPLQYPDGFYVWLSDGRAHYDAERHILFHVPVEDTPGVNHWVKLRPPLEGQTNEGWDYFFRGDEMVNGR